MRTQELATLILRLLGIFFCVEGIPYWGQIGYGISNFSGRLPVVFIVTAILPGVMLLLCGVLLIGFSTSLGHRIAPISYENQETASPVSRDLQALLFSVAGAIIVG